MTYSYQTCSCGMCSWLACPFDKPPVVMPRAHGLHTANRCTYVQQGTGLDHVGHYTLSPCSLGKRLGRGGGGGGAERG